MDEKEKQEIKARIEQLDEEVKQLKEEMIQKAEEARRLAESIGENDPYEGLEDFVFFV